MFLIRHLQTLCEKYSKKIFQESLSLEIDSSQESRYTRNSQEVDKTSSENFKEREDLEIKYIPSTLRGIPLSRFAPVQIEKVWK